MTKTRPRKATVIRFAKWVIGIVVAFGLWRTVDSALDQIRDQRAGIRAEVAQIEAEIRSFPVSHPLEPDGNHDDAIRDLTTRRDRLLVQDPQFTAMDWPRVLLAAMVYAFGLLPAACFFHQTLVHMRQRPRMLDSIRAHVLGHAGKYVPGKAMVVVMRVGAIAGPDVRAGVAAVAVFVETLLMMAVGGAIGGLLVFLLDVPVWIRLLAVVLAACASLPTLPPLFRWIISRLAKSRLGTGKGLDDAMIDGSLMLRGWAWMILMWIAIGTSFSLILQATPGTQIESFAMNDYLLATAAVAIAMVAGFLSLLPGGAGIRELVLSTMLAPRFGLAPALVAAVVARLVFLGVELAATGLLWKRRSGSKRIRNEPEQSRPNGFGTGLDPGDS